MFSNIKYYIYQIDKYGCKKYFLGDKTFIHWIVSTCGATSYECFNDVREMMEFITKKEKITVYFQTCNG